jgi:hypothetical protein
MAGRIIRPVRRRRPQVRQSPSTAYKLFRLVLPVIQATRVLLYQPRIQRFVTRTKRKQVVYPIKSVLAMSILQPRVYHSQYYVPPTPVTGGFIPWHLFQRMGGD